MDSYRVRLREYQGWLLHGWRYLTLSPHTCSCCCNLFEINHLSIDDTPTQSQTFCNLSVYIYYTAAAPGVNWSHSYMRYLYPRTLQHPEVCGWQLMIDNFTDATDCTEFRSPINCYLTCFFLLRTTEMILTWIGSRKTNNPNLKEVSQLLLCIKVTPRYKWPFHVDKIWGFSTLLCIDQKVFFSDIIGRKDLISEGVT